MTEPSEVVDLSSSGQAAMFHGVDLSNLNLNEPASNEAEAQAKADAVSEYIGWDDDD